MKWTYKLMAMATFCLASLSVMAQTKKELTLEDLVYGGKTYSKYHPARLSGLRWKGDTAVWTKDGYSYALDARHMKLSSAPITETSKLRSKVSKDKVKPLRINADKSALGMVAHAKKNNLYIDDLQLTDEAEGIVCGQTVSRNEFGIGKGTFWSPSGRYLAYYIKDESGVSQYPIVDITKRVAELENFRYPMAGMTSEKIQVAIYDTESKKTVHLQTGDPTDKYYTNIAWGPKEENLYLIELNRDQNHSKLCRYAVADGSMQQVLIEEKSDKYVEPQHPIQFLPWDDDKFIYQTRADGYNHLYIYGTDGKLVKQLTKGEWLVQDVMAIDAKKKTVLIKSTEISPLQSNIYSVSVRNGKRTLIGEGKGVHYGLLSDSKRYLIDVFTAHDTPRKVTVIDLYHPKKQEVIQDAPDPQADCVQPEITVGTIKAADGATDLYYRLTKPVDFDPNKKYPTVVYVYGGPHAQLVRDVYQWDADGRDIYMAEKGYVCFTLDSRGSNNRGLEFENATFRQLGIEECKDQVKGVEFLKSLPYVDGDRIGVHGWSFGGHMTTALMLRYPEIFKVGVAGGAVIDWSKYEVMYGERYMDTPESNPEGYAATDLTKMAGQLKGRLLMIHDDHDVTVVPQHTLSFMKACVEARTYPDLLIYPNHPHNVRGKDRVHLTYKIVQYFEDHLK